MYTKRLTSSSVFDNVELKMYKFCTVTSVTIFFPWSVCPRLHDTESNMNWNFEHKPIASDSNYYNRKRRKLFYRSTKK